MYKRQPVDGVVQRIEVALDGGLLLRADVRRADHGERVALVRIAQVQHARQLDGAGLEPLLTRFCQRAGFEVGKDLGKALGREAAQHAYLRLEIGVANLGLKHAHGAVQPW